MAAAVMLDCVYAYVNPMPQMCYTRKFEHCNQFVWVSVNRTRNGSNISKFKVADEIMKSTLLTEPPL